MMTIFRSPVLPDPAQVQVPAVRSHMCWCDDIVVLTFTIYCRYESMRGGRQHFMT